MSARCWLSAWILLCLGMLPGPVHGAEPGVKPPLVKTVYVPWEELDRLLDRDDVGILLPRAEFDRLTAANAGTANDPETGEIEGISANYEGRLEGDLLTLDATWEFQQGTGTPQVWRLPLKQLAIESATLDNETARMARDPSGDLLVSSPDAGKHVLRLKLTTPLVTQGGERLAFLRLPKFPSGQLSLRVPPEKYLHWGNVRLERPAPDGEEAQYKLPIGGLTEAVLKITDKLAAPSNRSIVVATTALGLHVAPEEQTWRSTTALTVHGQAIDRLAVELPAELELVSVEAIGLDHWDFQREGEISRIQLHWRQPFDGERQLTLQGIVPRSTPEPWNVPTQRFPGVAAHQVQLLVQSDPSVRLRQVSATGIQRVAQDPTQASSAAVPPLAGTPVAETLQSRYAAWTPGFSLVLETLVRTRELAVTSATHLSLDSSGLMLESDLELRPRFGSLFDFDIRLPAEWTVQEMTVEGQPVSWTAPSAEPGWNILRVIFSPPVPDQGKAALRLVALLNPGENWPPEEGPVVQTLPVLEFPQANVLLGRYLISTGDDLELSPVEFQGLDPVAVALPDSPGISTQGWEHQDSQYSGKLRLIRRPSRLFARTLGVHRLGRETRTSSWMIQLLAQGGGERAIQIALPAATGTNLQFRVLPDANSGALPVRLASQSSSVDADGQRLWTLRFSKRLQGLVRLAVDSETPRPAGEDAWEVPAVQVVGAERQFGQVGIEAELDQQLEVVATDSAGQALRAIDAADLSAGEVRLAQQRIVEAFEMVRPGEHVVLRETRYEPGSIPGAICTRMNLLSLLNTSGEIQHRVELSLKSVGAQSLLVQPPGDVELWGVQVDGLPTEIRRLPGAEEGAGTFSIPLVTVVPPERERLVRIFYRTQFTHTPGGDSVTETPPRLQILTGRGEQRPVETLRREWTLAIPSSLQVVQSAGDFRPQSDLQRRGWLSWWQQIFLPTSDFSLLQRLLLLAAMAGTPWILRRLWILLRLLSQPLFEISVSSWLLRVGAVVLMALVLVWILIGTLGGPVSGVFTQINSDLSSSFASSEAEMPRTLSPRPSVGPGDAVGAAPPATKEAANGAEGAPRELLEEARDAEVPDQKPARKGKPGGKGGKAGEEGEAGPGGQKRPAQPARRPPVRGRLSLAMDLKVPSDSESLEWTQDGLFDGARLPTLSVALTSRTSLRSQRIAWQLATILAFWLFRGRPWSFKLLMALFTLAIPWALQPLVHPRWIPLLDGLFLGGGLGCLLWGAIALSRMLLATVPAKGAAPLLLLCWLAWPSAPVTAAQPPTPAAPAPARVEDRVIIPFEAGGKERPEGPVLVPWHLHRRWTREAAKVSPADLPPQFSQVDVQIIPEKGTTGQKGRARVSSRQSVVTTGRVSTLIPLPLAGVTPLRVELDGEPAVLVPGATPDAPLRLAVAEPGRHELLVEFHLPAEVAEAEGRLTLQLAAVAAGRIRLRLPAADTQLMLKGASQGFRRETVGGETWANIAWEQPGPLSLNWGPMLVRAAEQAAFEVDATSSLTVSDVGTGFQSRLRTVIRNGSLREMRFSVPRDWLVREVAGADVTNWELDETQDPPILKATLRRAVTDSTTLDLGLLRPGEFAESAVTVEVPVIGAVDAVRQTGLIGLFAPERFELVSGTVSGVTQVDTNQFPQAETPVGQRLCPVGLPRPQSAFRYRQQPFELSWQVSRQRLVSRAEAAHRVEITSRRQTFDSLFTLEIPSPPRAALSIQLPEGYQLAEVDCEGATDFWISGGGAGQTGTLHLEFATPRSGRVVVQARGFIPRLLDDPVAIIAPPVPQEINELKSTLALWIDPAFSPRVEDSNGWKTLDPSSLTGDLFQRPGTPARFAFQANALEALPLALLLDPAEVRVSAAALSQVLVRDTSVDQLLFLRWKFPAAAARQVSFEVPEWLSARLEVESPDPVVRIREIQREPRPLGRTRLTVQLEEPRATELVLHASASFAIPESGRIPAALVTFEQPVQSETGRTYRTVENQQSYVLLVNQGWRRMTNPQASDLETITVDDLPFRLPENLRQQMTGLWRAREARAVVEWQQEPATSVRALGAVVNYAGLNQVVTPDGSWRLSANYRVVNRSRQFLPLKLPEGAKILSVFVRGEPSRPVDPDRPEAAGLALIPLPLTAVGDRGCEVQVVLQGRLPQPLPAGIQVFRSTIDLPAPSILSTDEDPDLGMPVAATEWTVWLPKDLSIERVDDPNRTNVSESIGGIERVLSTQREWLDLFRKLGDSSISDSARQRIRYNLKQFDRGELDMDLVRYDRWAEGTGLSQEQRLELNRLSNEVSSAKAELNKKSPGPEASLTQINSRQLQGELFLNNYDVAPNDPVGPATSKPNSGTQPKFLKNSRADLNEQVERQTREQLSNRARIQQGSPQSQAGSEAQLPLQSQSAAGRRGEELLEELEQDFGRQSLNQRRRPPSDGEVAQGRQQGGQGQPPAGNGRPGMDRTKAGPSSPRSGGRGQQQVRNDGLPPAAVDQDPLANAPAFQNAGFGEGLRGSQGAAARTAGLSLPVSIPETGQKRTFHKSEGAPRLALSIRPRESSETGWRLGWGAVWLAEAAFLAWLASGLGTLSGLRRWGWGLTSLGTVWVLVCGMSYLGLIPFVFGLWLLSNSKEG